MKNVDAFNKEQNFIVNLKESRLKKVCNIIAKMKPGKMLDVGCSAGDFALYWQQRGQWDGHGVDLNEQKVKEAKQKGLKAEVCNLSSQPLPFEKELFDLIFAGEVIEHLVDGDGFLKEMHRCIKDKGFLIITTPNLASLENRIKLVLGKYPRWVDFRLGGEGHVRAFTFGVLQTMLSENGFKVISRTGNFVPVLPQSIIDDIKFPPLSILGTMFPGLAMDIIILAQKEYKLWKK
jgi:ubiquinone/menaquinone biosynthesis C-methylase UbiE